jgi:hypothetical protein
VYEKMIRTCSVPHRKYCRVLAGSGTSAGVGAYDLPRAGAASGSAAARLLIVGCR